MFIDSTYFVGEINVPTAASTDTVLNQAISQYEKELLISLLGYKLYSLLIADCTDYVPATIKYKNLVNGAEFTHVFNGQSMTLKWEGLKNAAKISPIAYYVFYKYVERDVTRLYGTGVSMAKANEGWDRVSPMNKLINAWDRMRDLYGKIPPEYKPIYTRPILGTNLPCVFDAEASAYNYLFANKTDFPDWIFTPIWMVNPF